MEQPLRDLLLAVHSRIVVQYANQIRHIALAQLPSALETALDRVSSRTVFQYADDNREVTLGYPLDLVDDKAPPQISEVEHSGSTITWTTDEFATSAVQYGTQPGAYTNSVEDDLFVRQHTMSLPALSPGATYYYKIQATDRSGNTSASAELQLMVSVSVYLPVVVGTE